MSPHSLTSLFGKSPRVELLELLAIYAKEEVSVPFLAEQANVSTASLYKYVNQLVDEGLVALTRKVGGTQYYTLNLKNEEACLISYLQNTFLANLIAEEIRELGGKTLAEEIGEQESEQLTLAQESPWEPPALRTPRTPPALPATS